MLIFITILVAAVYGGFIYINSLSHEKTDDAQVRANMTPIIPM